jgi:peptide/nickel transport system substrate-binding protein
VHGNRSYAAKRAVSRALKIVIVLVIIFLIGGSSYLAFFFRTASPANSTTSTTNTATSSSHSSYSTTYPTTTSSYSAVCTGNQSELVDESPAAPYDSLDPAYGFFTGDGYFASVFQGLVAYNGNDSLQVVPALASSWTVSPNYENFTFTMRGNTWFSNKDPVNAYVAWFSFVRELYWNAPTTVGISNYQGLTVNTTSDVTRDGNVWPHGLRDALIQAGVKNNENSLTLALNQMLSNFKDTNSTQISIMSYPHQAYVAINSSTFQINLIQPYRSFLLAIAPQWGAIQDPVYIDAHGGVMNNTGPPGNSAVTGFSANGMPGTGSYIYESNPAQNPALLVLNENPNYWGSSITSGPLQAPHIPTIIMKFGLLPNTEISDFASCSTQISTPPIENLNQAYEAYHSNYSSVSFEQIFHTAGYPLAEIAYSLNTQIYPTNITLLRQAIVHSVNYSAIQQAVYSSNGTILGSLSIPPAPPGFGPLDNPGNIPLYSYNTTLAQQLANAAGIENHFSLKLPNGTIIGDRSAQQLANVTMESYPPVTPSLQLEINVVRQGLESIGVLTTFVVNTGDCSYGCILPTPQNTDPIVINGVAWEADWADPILQLFYFVATPPLHSASSSTGLSNVELNWVNNQTLTALLSRIPFETNATLQLQQTEQAYNLFTQLATMIQMPVPANYFFIQPNVKNVVYSSFQFAFLYNMIEY